MNDHRPVGTYGLNIRVPVLPEVLNQQIAVNTVEWLHLLLWLLGWRIRSRILAEGLEIALGEGLIEGIGRQFPHLEPFRVCCVYYHSSPKSLGGIAPDWLGHRAFVKFEKCNLIARVGLVG
jgi:hypothetical protein